MPDKKEDVLQKCRNAIDSGNPIMDYSFYYRVISLLEEQEKYISRISVEYLKLVKKVSKTPRIIRCKDCKYKECEGRDGLIVCDITGESHMPEWFCADGGRR